jgi:phage gp36-like protein
MPVVTGTQYASQTDLAQLGLAGGALQNVTPTIQDAALLAASALADSYLESRFTLPLTSWGKDLSRVVCFIAAYDILTSRGYSPQSPDDHIRQRYQDALAWLQEVSQGTQTPSHVADSSTDTQSGAVSWRGRRRWVHQHCNAGRLSDGDVHGSRLDVSRWHHE